MKFSLNVAKFFGGEVDFSSFSKEELVQKMGLQLGAIEDFEDYSDHYTSVCVAKVVACEKHPNADKLSVCRIDDGGVNQHVERGEDGFVQVVCGAPNVRAGIFVAWIPPGATVPSTFADSPFVLDARELRGILSNGMLASAKELNINDDHDSILEIKSDDIGRVPVPGEAFAGLYGLDDFVVTCENKMFTHRPDCFGNLGIAREVAGIFGYHYKSPEWYIELPHFTDSGELELATAHELPELVPRFMTVIMSNVTVGPSPLWMQAYLKRVGIKPINNVVDVTNYVMHLTGQPTHAFDYDKLRAHSSSPSLFPRMSIKGEKIMLLGQKEVTLTGEEIVISTDQKAVALAGVMGGTLAEVDEHTKTIVVECATFDMYNVRRTSMRHGLFTEAVTRFNKGQSPLQNDRVLAFVMKNMAECAGAEQASSVSDMSYVSEDVTATQSLSGTLAVSCRFINNLLGSDLSAEDISELLQRVEFNVVAADNDILQVTAPFWRTDISIAEDLVEEVGRLYGYDKLPVALPARSTKPAARNAILDFAYSLRYKLKEAGANEVLTYSFVHGDLLKKVGIDADEWAYHLRNALSPDLQYYRPSLLPSLLAKVYGNIKAQAGSDHNEFALFEIGKAHVKGEFETTEPSLPKQMRRLAFVFTADEKTQEHYEGSAYYLAKKYVDVLTQNQAVYMPLDTNKYPITAPYLLGRSAVVELDGEIIGVIGELRSEVKKSLKLPQFTAGFELDLDLLHAQTKRKPYKPLSPFPHSSQDVSLEVSSETSWFELTRLIVAELELLKAENGYDYELEPLDIYKKSGESKKRFTYRLSFSHHNKTLKTEELSSVLDSLAKAAHESLGAVRC